MTFTSAAASPRPLHAPAGAGDHRAGARAQGDGRLAGPVPSVPAGGSLPPVQDVLAVITRPGQESAVLGGLLYAFHRAGARLAVRWLVRGQPGTASTSMGSGSSRCIPSPDWAGLGAAGSRSIRPATACPVASPISEPTTTSPG